MTTLQSPTKIRVLTADDHPLLRDGIASVVNGEPDMQLIAMATNGSDAVRACLEHRPDVALLDIRMPVLDGFAALDAIIRQWPAAKVVMLTSCPGDAQARLAFQRGARGYALKSMPRQQVADVVRQVHGGRRYLADEISIDLASRLDEAALSARELQVLSHVAGGLANKEIAAHLGVTEDTIKAHMKSVLLKLRANDRTHAVTIAVRRGLIALAASS